MAVPSPMSVTREFKYEYIVNGRRISTEVPPIILSDINTDHDIDSECKNKLLYLLNEQRARLFCVFCKWARQNINIWDVY